MTKSVDAHPTVAVLTSFAQGTLSDEQAEQSVARHVESCNQCAAVVDKHSMNSGVFAEELEAAAVSQLQSVEQAFQIPDSDLANDTFELQEIVGSGGMGHVFRAWQPALQRHVAIKQLHRHLAPGVQQSHSAVARFHREVRALGRVRHPNLVRIYSSGVSDDGWLYYCMEFLPGADLSEVFAQLAGKNPKNVTWRQAVDSASRARCARIDIPKPAALRHEESDCETDLNCVAKIIRQVAHAANALHEAGIIHRDIKPGNIMVNPTGDHATLTDLGLARCPGVEGVPDALMALTQTNAVLGTQPYIAPELLSGKAATIQSDVYNVGVILWELLSRRRLFFSDKTTTEAMLLHRIRHEIPQPIRKFRQDVSRQLEAVVATCLHKDPAARYSDMTEFVNDFDRAMRGESVVARPRSFVTRAGRFFRKHRARVVQIVAAVMLQLAITAVIYWASVNSGPSESQVLPVVEFEIVDGIHRPRSISNLQVNNATYNVEITYDHAGGTWQLQIGHLPIADLSQALGELQLALNNAPNNDSNGVMIRFMTGAVSSPVANSNEYQFQGSLNDVAPGDGHWEYTEGVFNRDELQDKQPHIGFAQFRVQRSDNFRQSDTAVQKSTGQKVNNPLRITQARSFGGGGAIADSNISATYNGAGLGQFFSAQLATHSSNTADAFVSASGSNVSLHYDFGEIQSIDQIRIWNFHNGKSGPNGSSQGVHHIRVFSSNSPDAYENPGHESWSLILPITVSRAPFDGATNPCGESHVFPQSTAARFIRIQADDNYGAATVGISEVQFLNNGQRSPGEPDSDQP